MFGDTKTLVWLASYPKSGNTWLRAFLANYMIDTDEPVSINDMQKISFGDSALEPIAAIARRDPRTLPPQQLAAAREANLERIATDGAAAHFVKTHNAHIRVASHWLIPARLTRQAVYLIRNPLDLVISYADHWGLSFEAAAKQIGSTRNVIPANTRTVTQFLGKWSDHVRGWARTRDFKVLVLRYEDLLDDPMTGFERILRHIEVPIEPNVIEQAIRFSSFESLSSQEAAGGFREKSEPQQRFFRKGTSGQWRDTLPQEVIERIIADHGPTMKHYKYL